MWIPFFSLLLGGITVSIGGKQPDILYFDIVFGIWLAYQMFFKGLFPSVSGVIVSLGVFCVLSGLVSTLVNCRDMYRGVAAAKVLAVGILVYAVAKKAPVSVLAASVFGAGTSLLLLRDYQSLRYEHFASLSSLKDEIEVAMGRSNTVASVLILLIPLAVAGACMYKGAKRLICVACALVTCGGLLATMSRGAILAIVAATLFSVPVLHRAGMKLKHWLVVLGLLGLTIAIVPAELLDTNVALFVYRFENPDHTREEIMRASWDAFVENPVFGVGPGELGSAINHHLMVPTVAGTRQYNAHNLVIDSLAEMGLPTGLALLILVALVLRRAWRTAASRATAFNVAVWIGLLAAVLHNMVEASFEGEQFQVVFWAVAALAGSQPQPGPAAMATRT